MNNRLKMTVIALVFSSLQSAVHAGASGSQTLSSSAELVKLHPMFDGKMNDYRPAKTLAVGVWGGRDISLEVSKDTATLEFACAHGEVSGRILLDRSGRFNVTGTYFREGPGPTRGDQERGDQVLFKGKVTGQSMELTVTRKDTKAVLGTFVLTHGRTSIIRKCR